VSGGRNLRMYILRSVNQSFIQRFDIIDFYSLHISVFTDTGFWDTFRCLFPLLNLMYPSVNKEMQEGLINTYKESGFFPEWASPGHRGCMVGNNSASILVDAYMKGVRRVRIPAYYSTRIPIVRWKKPPDVHSPFRESVLHTVYGWK